MLPIFPPRRAGEQAIATDLFAGVRKPADRVLDQAGPARRALYADSFSRMVSVFTAPHEKGSPPDVVATPCPCTDRRGPVRTYPPTGTASSA